MLKKNIYISEKKLHLLTCLYIYVPVVIFLLGFVKIWWALITIGIMAAVVYGFAKHISQVQEREKIQFPWWLAILCILFFLGVGILSGWGGWFPQAGDWGKHNAVLRDLTERSWPVYYVNDNETSALTYYIGAYIFPAFVGKVFHSFHIAELVQYFYNVFGLLLLFLNALVIVRARKKSEIVIFMVGMIFYSGALIFAQYLSGYLGSGSLGEYHWLKFETLMFQYRSVFVNLRWVFPQFIVPCLIGVIFWQYRTYVRYYVIILLPMLLYGSLPFLGVLPIAGLTALVLLLQKKVTLREIISIENVMVSLSLGIILILYFIGNVASEKPYAISLHLADYSGWRAVGIYLLFCLFMFGVYALVVCSRNKRNILFWGSVIDLLAIPFFVMGVFNDFVMSCSIVPMFYMLLFVYEYIFNEKNTTAGFLGKILLLLMLFAGAIYPAREMIDVLQEARYNHMVSGKFEGRYDVYVSLESYADRSKEEEDDMKYNYYTYDLDENIFYLYIARQKITD